MRQISRKITCHLSWEFTLQFGSLIGCQIPHITSRFLRFGKAYGDAASNPSHSRWTNIPPREAAAMSRAQQCELEYNFKVLGGGAVGSVQKSSLSRSKSDHKAHALHLDTTTTCPPAAQSARIHVKPLNCPVWVLSNRPILTLSCHHSILDLRKVGVVYPLSGRANYEAIRWSFPHYEHRPL